MFQGIEMKCPEDGSVLIHNKAEAYTGYGCLLCRSSWLPKSYIDSIQYTKEFDPQKFFSTLKNSVQETTSFKCPVNCGVLNSITDFNGVSYCPSCLGVWFKSKALKNILKNYQTKRENLVIADVPNATIGIFDLLGSLFK
jgi:Zn-finger nucleic acid-binding protein